MDSENPSDNVFVDLDAKGWSDLLGYSLAAPGAIAPFYFNDGLDGAEPVSGKTAVHVSLPRLLNDCGELPINKTTQQINKFMLKSAARNDAKVFNRSNGASRMDSTLERYAANPLWA
jgi:hypothetical protein